MNAARIIRAATLVGLLAAAWTLTFCPTVLALEGRWVDLLALTAAGLFVLVVWGVVMLRDEAADKEDLLDVVAQLTKELHETRLSRKVVDRQLGRVVVNAADNCPNYLACAQARGDLARAREALKAPQESGL